MDNSLIVSKSYPVKNVQFDKSAPYSSAYSVSTSGVSRSGSTENDTSCTSSRSSSANFVCNFAILLVIGKQTVSQFVKIKSATHHFPAKSSLERVSPSWVVNSKSATGASIFVSTSSPPQAVSTIAISAKSNICIYFFIKYPSFYVCSLLCSRAHNKFKLIIPYKEAIRDKKAFSFMTCL